MRRYRSLAEVESDPGLGREELDEILQFAAQVADEAGARRAAIRAVREAAAQRRARAEAKPEGER